MSPWKLAATHCGSASPAGAASVPGSGRDGPDWQGPGSRSCQCSGEAGALGPKSSLWVQAPGLSPCPVVGGQARAQADPLYRPEGTEEEGRAGGPWCQPLRVGRPPETQALRL